MYYAQQSPGIAHKLAQHPGQMHDQTPWTRNAHHSVLGPPQPPGSTGYPLFTHANGGMTALQHRAVQGVAYDKGLVDEEEEILIEQDELSSSSSLGRDEKRTYPICA